MPDAPAPEQLLDAAYRERAHLVALMAAKYPSVIAPAPDVDEPGWQIVYVRFGGWQGSWHISPADADLFSRVPHVPADDARAQWDGHTTDQKYARIRSHTRVLWLNAACDAPMPELVRRERATGNGGYWQEWYCTPPELGTVYQVNRDEWDTDPTTGDVRRKILAITLGVEPTPSP